MKYIVGGEEMARIDKYSIEEIGIPQMVLMERAALEVFKFIENGFLKTAIFLLLLTVEITAVTELRLQDFFIRRATMLKYIGLMPLKKRVRLSFLNTKLQRTSI